MNPLASSSTPLPTISPGLRQIPAARSGCASQTPVSMWPTTTPEPSQPNRLQAFGAEMNLTPHAVSTGAACVRSGTSCGCDASDVTRTPSKYSVPGSGSAPSAVMMPGAASNDSAPARYSSRRLPTCASAPGAVSTAMAPLSTARSMRLRAATSCARRFEADTPCSSASISSPGRKLSPNRRMTGSWPGGSFSARTAARPGSIVMARAGTGAHRTERAHRINAQTGKDLRNIRHPFARIDPGARRRLGTRVRGDASPGDRCPESTKKLSIVQLRGRNGLAGVRARSRSRARSRLARPASPPPSSTCPSTGRRRARPWRARDRPRPGSAARCA